MASTYLGRPCKPWLRFDRDTWRVNESPREAREHFASRLKAWVRFRPRMFFFVFRFFFSKNEEEVLRKAGVAHVDRRLLRYYLIVRRLPNVFALACRS